MKTFFCVNPSTYLRSMSIFYVKIVIVINNMIQRLSTATKLMGLKYSSGLFLKGNGSNHVMFINNTDV